MKSLVPNYATDNLRKGIVRVLKSSGETAGTGFIAAPHLVVTCAHVVNFSHPSREGVAKKIKLKLLEDGREIDAWVEKRYWSPSEENDIAVLRVKRCFTLDYVMKLGTSVNVSGHEFRTYGFPNGITDGILVKGFIEDENPGSSLLQLSSNEVTEGVSGAPVLDTRTCRVVGIVTARAGLDLQKVSGKTKGKTQVVPISTGRLESIAFATSSQIITTVCPELNLDDICPYKGLLAFTENDSQFFYGRDKLISRLEDSLTRSPRFLGVVGASGSGKSSVVRAGLIPSLRQNILAFEDCIIVSVRAITLHKRTLQDILIPAILNTGNNISTRGVNHKSWEDLLLLIESFERRIVIFIDQFEDLFSSQTSKNKEFTRDLLSLVEDFFNVTIIITVRSDFYSDLLQSGFDSWLEAGQVNTSRISSEEMKESILKPAEGVGLRLEPGLAQLIVDDLSTTTKNPLPLLQFTLTRLWELEHGSNALTSSKYTDIGRAVGSLTMWADETYYSFDDIEQKLVKQLFTRLVRCGSANTPDTRIHLKISNIEKSLKEISALGGVLRKLIDSRLIVSYDDNGEEYIEIIHDVLVREWQLLQRWVLESREVLAQRDRIEIAAEEWKSKAEAKDYLWQGKTLKKALQFKTEHEENLNLSLDSKEFLRASLSRRRRKIWTSMGVSLVAPISISTVLVFQVRKELRLRQYWDVIESHSESSPISSSRMSDALKNLYRAGKSFSGISFENASFSRIQLRGADFQGSNLQSASIETISFQNADFRSANLQDTRISHSDFQNATLDGANLSNSMLSTTNFTDADLSRLNAKGSVFSLSEFVNVNLIRADLTNTQFFFSDFNKANMSAAYLSGSKFTGTDLSETKLDNTKLCSSVLTNASLNQSTMKNALFIGSDLRNANFRASDLTNSDLTDANIDNADFREVKGLSFQQIKAAKNWESAIYDPGFRNGLMNHVDDDNAADDLDQNRSISSICRKPSF